MPAYFDSSVLISILKNDTQAKWASDLWKQTTDRVSSVLLEAECLIALRRNFQAHLKRLPSDWLSLREERLKMFLEEIDLRQIDNSIVKIIQEEPRLSNCRTLDALHIATGLFFKSAAPDDFLFYSFDERMNQIANSIGLKVLSTT